MSTGSKPNSSSPVGFAPGGTAGQHLTPLETKLRVPPPRSGWISRSRLEKRLDEGLERKLTLISAPAGFGKTTLLVNWIDRKKIPAAWFSLDITDNDPQYFLASVILALQRLEPQIGMPVLKILESPQPPPLDTILINLLNDISRISNDLVLVLDDYHLVDPQSVHEMVGFCLENMPDQMHMIIATRSDPPLSLSRLRSQNLLTELRAADLSFSIDESTKLLNQMMDLKLSAPEIQILEKRTEGWAAGLQLAALSLKGRKDSTEFINGFKGDNRYIADYLAEEVLNRQPDDRRQFLLQTSILGRLCGPLCDTVTDQPNCDRILMALEKDNLFVIPLDEERRWYRYHHLFADLLEKRLITQQEDLVADLHRRASQWFNQNGYKNEAVDHAFLARDFDHAAQLIEDIAELDWDRARESRLFQWIKNLPDENIDANPKLCIFYARELFKSGQLDDAENRLQAAEQILDTKDFSDSDKENLRGRVAVIRAYMASRTGDVPQIIQFANQALDLLPQTDLTWRSVAATTLGFAYGWAGAGDLIKAQQAFSMAMKISKEAGNIYYNVFAGSCLGTVMSLRGKLRETEDICHKSLDLSRKYGIEETGIVGSLYGTLGMICCERGDFEKGIRLINKGIELADQGQDPVILASCKISLLRAFIYRMDIGAAFKIIDTLNESTSNFALPPWISNTISAFNVMFWLAGGNLNRALQWVDERGLSIDDELENLRGVEYMALTHILIAQNRLDDAAGFSQRLFDMAQAGDNVILQIEARLLRSLIFAAMLDKTNSLRELQSALALGEPGNFKMIFISKGKPVADLLEEIVAVQKQDRDDDEAGFSPAYAKKLLSAFKAVMPPKVEGLLDPISERELEVLHLIAAGLSNKEIAAKLFISLNTVKTHTKNINSKLGVNSRTQAVAKAKKLKLL